MMGDYHVRFCEGLGGQFPWSTRHLLFSLVNVLENVTVHEPQTKNPQGLWFTLLYRIAYPQKVGCARGHGATPPRICSPSHKKQLTVSITPNVLLTAAAHPR